MLICYYPKITLRLQKETLIKRVDKNSKSPASDYQSELEKTTLLFVYNAASGFFNLAADIARKIFSPQTYDCNLCAITHDAFAMKNEWRQYLDALDAPVEFLHADEFKTQYPFENARQLPAVFRKENDGLELIISPDEINSCRTARELKQIINARLDD